MANKLFIPDQSSILWNVCGFDFIIRATSVSKCLSAPVVYVLMLMLWCSRSVCTLWKRTRCCVLRWRWRSTSQQIRPSTCCRIWGRGWSGTGTMSESVTARFCKYLIMLELFQLQTKFMIYYDSEYECYYITSRECHNNIDLTLRGFGKHKTVNKSKYISDDTKLLNSLWSSPCIVTHLAMLTTGSVRWSSKQMRKILFIVWPRRRSLKGEKVKISSCWPQGGSHATPGIPELLLTCLATSIDISQIYCLLLMCCCSHVFAFYSSTFTPYSFIRVPFLKSAL